MTAAGDLRVCETCGRPVEVAADAARLERAAAVVLLRQLANAPGYDAGAAGFAAGMADQIAGAAGLLPAGYIGGLRVAVLRLGLEPKA